MLILVRHGRTEANAQGLLQGRIDLPLDEVGERQAVAVAAFVGPVDEVVSSPLQRARQTAAAFGADVEVDDRWIELAYGKYEGVKIGDVDDREWRRWAGDPTFTPEGGESLAVLHERVSGACETLVERARDRNVVVVSHVSPMKSAVAWTLGCGVEISWRSHLSQAAVCRIEMRERGPVLLSFNETAPYELSDGSRSCDSETPQP